MTSLPRIAALAPGPWFKTADAETYRSLYVEQLARLDPVHIVERIDALAQGQIPVLCCWERITVPGQWCHRAWLSVWFVHTLGLVVTELHDASGGYGTTHAMLPPEYRRSQLEEDGFARGNR